MCIEHIKALLECGADRVIVNSEALRNIKFIDQIVQTFGSQFLTVSIEAKKIGNKYYCMIDHGRENSNKILSDWIKQLNKYNVGEIHNCKIKNSVNNGVFLSLDDNIDFLIGFPVNTIFSLGKNLSI